MRKLMQKLMWKLAISLVLALCWGGPRASAQIPGLPSLTPAAPAAPAAAAPAALPTAPVKFNKRTLFTVTASDPNKAQDRADLVGLRLDQALRSLTPSDPPPAVTVKSVGADIVVMLGDRPLLTATDGDAAAGKESTTQLANDWADTLEKALNQAQQERRPGFLRQALINAGEIVLIAALLTLAIWIISHRFLDRPGWPVFVLLWLVAASRITNLFPQTRPVHDFLKSSVIQPLFIFLVVALAAGALSRMLSLVLRRVFPPVPDTLSPEERTERTFRRRATLGAVARVTGIALIWIIALLVALTWAGVNLTALLASAGLIGVAIGLAAQDTTKDLVSGVNILIDDRFGVGDNIKVGEYSGTVETLNLRVTQIRDMSGRLITFPNRAVEVVANSTLRWAQVDFQVGVAYDTDLREAMHVMEETAQTLHEEWEGRLLDLPQMLGVDSFNPSDITLRMLQRTVPGDQWAVGRELRLRMKEAFDAHGIVITVPQMEITVVNKKGKNKPEAATDGSTPNGQKEKV